jgi:hypothetical protein
MFKLIFLNYLKYHKLLKKNIDIIILHLDNSKYWCLKEDLHLAYKILGIGI